MRGNGDGVYGDGWLEISIHASAWEATEILGLDLAPEPISIHASAWEATAKIHNLFDKIYIILYQTLFFL